METFPKIIAYGVFLIEHSGLVTILLLILVVLGVALFNKILKKFRRHLSPTELKAIEYVAMALLVLHCAIVISYEGKKVADMLV